MLQGSAAAHYNGAAAVVGCLMSLVWASLKGPQLDRRLPTGAKIRAMFSSPLGGLTAEVYSSAF